MGELDPGAGAITPVGHQQARVDQPVQEGTGPGGQPVQELPSPPEPSGPVPRHQPEQERARQVVAGVQTVQHGLGVSRQRPGHAADGLVVSAAKDPALEVAPLPQLLAGELQQRQGGGLSPHGADHLLHHPAVVHRVAVGRERLHDGVAQGVGPRRGDRDHVGEQPRPGARRQATQVVLPQRQDRADGGAGVVGRGLHRGQEGALDGRLGAQGEELLELVHHQQHPAAPVAGQRHQPEVEQRGRVPDLVRQVRRAAGPEVARLQGFLVQGPGGIEGVRRGRTHGLGEGLERARARPDGQHEVAGHLAQPRHHTGPHEGGLPRAGRADHHGGGGAPEVLDDRRDLVVPAEEQARVVLGELPEPPVRRAEPGDGPPRRPQDLLELLGHRLGGRAARRLAIQAAAEEHSHLVGHPEGGTVQVHVPLERSAPQGRQPSLRVGERAAAGDHLEQHHPERPHVDRAGEGLPEPLLRRHVGR